MTRTATHPATRDELTAAAAADAAIEQACRILRLPTIRSQHARVAEAAARQKAGYKGSWSSCCPWNVTNAKIAARPA
jgi:hypothetical protein